MHTITKRFHVANKSADQNQDKQICSRWTAMKTDQHDTPRNVLHRRPFRINYATPVTNEEAIDHRLWRSRSGRGSVPSAGQNM